MAVRWERWYPLMVSALVTLAGVIFFPLSGLMAELLDTGMTIAAVLIGFVGTIASILMSHDSRSVRFMKKIGKFDGLLRFLWDAIRMSFIFLAMSVVARIAAKSQFNVPADLTAIVWFFFGMWSLLSTYRAIKISMILIHRSVESD